MKINANFPQQKTLVAKTHIPLKEKKEYEKIYKYFIENHKTTCVKNSHIKSLFRLFSDFYFKSEQQIISYKRPL